MNATGRIQMQAAEVFVLIASQESVGQQPVL